MIRKPLMLIIVCFLLWEVGYAQLSCDSPVIGEMVPEFKLDPVLYYSRRTFSPSDIRGKWLVLDFWDKNCLACVQTFPKLNRLQNLYSDSIQIMLVARNGGKYNKGIEQMYDRYRDRLKLNLPIAYDTTLFKCFGVIGVPHVVVIDPGGRVYAITTADFLTAENLRSLIVGGKPAFRLKQNESQVHQNSSWKYFVDDNQVIRRDFIFRSVISKYDGELSQGYWTIDRDAKRGVYQAVGASLSELYQIAYFGEARWGINQDSMYRYYWRCPDVKTSDSSFFKSDYITKEGLYNYCLILSQDQGNRELLMDAMRADLRRCFGFEVFVEKRRMPYWRLTATDMARKTLITKSGTTKFKSDPTGIDWRRASVFSVVSYIDFYNSDEFCPFIDETRISNKIDIRIDAVMTDINDVRAALNKVGLILEKSEKEFNVLVIDDPLSESK